MTEALIIGGVLAFGVLLLWAVVKGAERSGASQEQAKQSKDVLDEVRKANEAMASVGSLDAESRRKRLQQWSRD